MVKIYCLIEYKQSTSSLQFFSSNFVLVFGPHFLWADHKNKKLNSFRSLKDPFPWEEARERNEPEVRGGEEANRF
jgi:hypothetical protein